MFTHADFNRRGRTIAYAFITTAGVRGLHFARVYRFVSGEVAYWARGRFIAWPCNVRIHNRIGHSLYVPAYLREYASPLPGEV